MSSIEKKWKTTSDILRMDEKNPWWTLAEWIKSWRTTMKNSGDKKDDEIEMKGERIDERCDDLDGGSDEMAEGIWTPEKKLWKRLELEFIHQEQTPKEGINHWMK